MTKDELTAMYEKYNAKAEKAFDNYQATGTQRYYREYDNNNDIASAVRIAINAVGDHNELLNLRSEIALLANRSLYDYTPEKTVKSLQSIARMWGLLPSEKE